jgi:hypothetical protein
MKKPMTKIIKMNAARHMVITPKARISFPVLFTPRENMNGDALNYSADLIFDSREDFKKPYAGKKIKTISLVQAVANAKRDQWGADKEGWPKMEYTPFKDGNSRISKADQKVLDGYKDGWFIQAKSGEKFPPKVLSRAGKPLTEADVYGGCYVQAQVMARPYSMGKNHGVRFILLAIQKLEDGERFGGGGANAMFDVTEEQDEDVEDIAETEGDEESDNENDEDWDD